MQFNTIQCNAIQYNAKQYNTTQHNTTEHNTIPYNTIQCDTTRHDTTRHDATRYDTIRYNTTQHNPTQPNTTQYNTIQYNATQYNTIQYNTCCQGLHAYSDTSAEDVPVVADPTELICGLLLSREKIDGGALSSASSFVCTQLTEGGSAEEGVFLPAAAHHVTVSSSAVTCAGEVHGIFWKI